MEEECSEILMSSLVKSGVEIPGGVSSIPDLTPSTLFSVCSQALRLIDPTASILTALPQQQDAASMSQRFNLCSQLASAFTSAGFIGDITFHKFLYPTEQDLYKLVRFLVERLPAGKDVVEKTTVTRPASVGTEELVAQDTEEVTSVETSKPTTDELLMVEFNRRSSELQDLINQHDLFKSAAEMAFDAKHPVSFYQEQISDQVQARRQNLVEVESQWEATKASMEEKCIGLEESVAAKLPEACEKIQQVRKVEREIESVLAAIKQRDEELLKLHSDLEKQPKLASRKSYIERIKEITKNSRKQDIDVERILKDTRELQLESNSIQERLHRTYAVVDETVFRVAKKDPGGQQLYRLLASIHENFEQMAEQIIAADRTRREVADYEVKLAAITSRSLNVDKLKADLDAIRKENELLEQRVNHI